jgi:hypothetical protein
MILTSGWLSKNVVKRNGDGCSVDVAASNAVGSNDKRPWKNALKLFFFVTYEWA